MERPKHIAILGGGAAGLAVGYYAKRGGLTFTVFEAAGRVGGNCKTLEQGEFRFDSGAHRFHNKDPETTRDLMALLGRKLARVDAPSHIYHDGKLILFPLSPLNLIRSLPPTVVARAAAEVAGSLLRPRREPASFEEFATDAYGKSLSSIFLLNYSEKLWGLPCRLLSPGISGSRLRGLDLKSFLLGWAPRDSGGKPHFDGDFLYPDRGFGLITDALDAFCRPSSIRTAAKITRVLHNGSRIQAVELNEKEVIPTDHVVSTLPLDRFVQMMTPPPPTEVMAHAGRLRFRDVILIALHLDRESVSRSATVYFPSSRFDFGRVCEPRNRSRLMSPAGRTSIVAEVACWGQEVTSASRNEALLERTVAQLTRIGWIKEQEIVARSVARLRDAYPVLEAGFDRVLAPILGYLGAFTNLRLAGRGGGFSYAHLHDVMKQGRHMVNGYLGGVSSRMEHSDFNRRRRPRM